MKSLVLFYSRTQITKKVAMELRSLINADIEEFFDTIDRTGIAGYLSAGNTAALKKLTVIKPLTHNLSDYDLIVIGTPVWAWTVSTPIRTLLVEQKEKIKQVAFFCTQGGSGAKGTFLDMAKIIDKQPVATLDLLTKEVIQDKFAAALNDFADKINKFNN